MPGYDGTGPKGAGPMTGRGRGYCILKENEENSSQVKGFIGLAGDFYQGRIENPKEVSFKPGGNITDPYGMRPITERTLGGSAGYPLPWYMYQTFPRPIGKYGQALFSGLSVYPSYTTRGVPFGGYSGAIWVPGRGKGRGWGRRCGFRYRYW